MQRIGWEVGNKNEKSVYVVLEVHKWAVEPLCQNVTTSYHLLFSFWVDVTENTKIRDFLFLFCSVFQKRFQLLGRQGQHMTSQSKAACESHRNSLH